MSSIYFRYHYILRLLAYFVEASWDYFRICSESLKQSQNQYDFGQSRMPTSTFKKLVGYLYYGKIELTLCDAIWLVKIGREYLLPEYFIYACKKVCYYSVLFSNL